MQILNTHGVYSYILKEMEWYAVDEISQQLTINTCMKAAEEAGCQYASIFVDPDAVMSIAPRKDRHVVWRHTFPVPDEVAFERELSRLLHGANVSNPRKRAILKLYMDSYSPGPVKLMDAAEPEPVAYRVKDFADGWILCHTREAAEREAAGAGNHIDPLYLGDD